MSPDSGLLDQQNNDGDVRLANLTAFQRDILWVLHHEGALHGLGIKSALQNYYREEVNTAVCTRISTNWSRWGCWRRVRAISVPTNTN